MPRIGKVVADLHKKSNQELESGWNINALVDRP